MASNITITAAIQQDEPCIHTAATHLLHCISEEWQATGSIHWEVLPFDTRFGRALLLAEHWNTTAFQRLNLNGNYSHCAVVRDVVKHGKALAMAITVLGFFSTIKSKLG